MIPTTFLMTSISLGKPRASGDDPLGRKSMLSGPQVNPARAGMIPGVQENAVSDTSKPRASGDDPSARVASGLVYS